MVGETRDQETAEMAINASLTGHFVLSTLHTNDASSAPTRLIDMGVQPFLISSSLVGVLAQRLVRTLCECKKPTKLTEFQMKSLDINSIPSDATVFEPLGCEKCNYTGYDSMTVVSELLMITDNVRALILEKADSSTIKKAAMKEGMETLRDSAVNLVMTGITSVEEVMRAIIAEGTSE
jgi:general secretion pathway protein E